MRYKPVQLYNVRFFFHTDSSRKLHELPMLVCAGNFGQAKEKAMDYATALFSKDKGHEHKFVSMAATIAFTGETSAKHLVM